MTTTSFRATRRVSCAAVLLVVAGCIPTGLKANWHRLNAARQRYEICELMFRHSISARRVEQVAYGAEEESYQAALAAHRRAAPAELSR